MTTEANIVAADTDPENELRELVTDILREAERQGASAAEVSAADDVGLSVSARKGTLETVEYNKDRGFGITVYDGLRKGSASTSDGRREAIAETVRAALNIARYTEEDPFCGLADAERMAVDLPDLEMYRAWPLDASQAERLAIECESAGLEVDERLVNSDGAHVNTQRSFRVYGNSHGFLGVHKATRHGMSCTLIAEDAAGMQRDYWYTSDCDPARLESATSVGRVAAERTLAKLSPRKAPTGRFPVLFCPQLARGLVSHYLGAISGGAQFRQASFLLNKLSERVAASHLTLREEPLRPGWPGSAAFDGDGVATAPKPFLESGVVSNYVLSAYSARKLGLETTGNAGGVHNVCIDGDARSFEALLQMMDTGFYVTEMMGQGVNGVTGDYSRGAAGFWIEGGEITYPVHEVTVAGNLKDMLNDIVQIGTDVDMRGNIRAPSILVEGMTVAGG